MLVVNGKKIPYTFSERKDKKYKAIVDGRVIHFSSKAHKVKVGWSCKGKRSVVNKVNK